MAMNEVKRYDVVPSYQTCDCGNPDSLDCVERLDGDYVFFTDFDAERQARLEAERQVGELREQLAKEAVWGRFAGWLLDHCEGQQIYEERLQYWLSEMIAHENATSTEGKDEYCGDHCTAFDQVEDFIEGKDDTTADEESEDGKKVFFRANTKVGQRISIADMRARYTEGKDHE